MKRAALAVALLLTFAPAIAPAAPVHVVGAASNYTASSSRAPTVTSLVPVPGSRVRSFYPQFSATIDTHGRAPLNRASVHLFVDGMDVSASASLTQNTLTYLPRVRVSSGWHDVFLEGADTAGQKFSNAWVFILQPPDVDIDPVTGGFGFFPVGSPQFGFMHFVLIAPTDGFAALQLCGIPQLAFVHVRLSPVFFVTVPVTIGNGFSPFFGCDVGAFFSPFGQFTQINPVFIPLPIGIAGPNVQPNIPLPQSAQTRRTLPMNRAPEIPVMGAPAPQMFVGTPRNAMPTYRTMPLPNAPVALPGMRTAPSTTVSGTRATLPMYRTPAAPVHVPVTVPPPTIPQPIPH
jgi:hypothetical protein